MPDFRLPGDTLPAFYAYVVAAVTLISIVAARGNLEAFTALSRRVGPPLAIMGVVVAALWLTRAQPPPLGTVNGTYTSACCAPVQLKDGVVMSGAFRVPFKLSVEKSGLGAVSPVTIGVRAGQVTAMPDPVLKTGWFVTGAKTEMIVGGHPAPFIFSDDRKSFTLCDARCHTEYQFVRR